MGNESVLRGMVLAAGFGTRLAPVTDQVPKPLLPVGGTTVLDQAVAALDRAGIRDVAVNTHHLGSMIADHLQGRPDAERFTIFSEDEILGTGGALNNAREFLAAGDSFVVFNGDVLCDVDLSALIDEHRRHDALATLLLVDHPAINTVVLGADGAVSQIQGAGPELADESNDPLVNLTYAGIGVFSRRVLSDLAPGFSSLITPLVRGIQRNPGCVRGYAPGPVYWNDLGTLPRFLRMSFEVQNNPEKFSWLEKAIRPTRLPLALQPITGHGSERRFWRLAGCHWSAVAMQCPLHDGQDHEFSRHLAIGRFLRQHDLGAAEILSVNEDEQTVLMEDLGQGSLFLLARNAGTPPVMLADRYRQVVDHLLRLQAFTDTARAECPLAVDRCLDEDALRWETTYFREQFLEGYLGLDEAQARGLIPWFEALAHGVANQPRVLLHRDFQSQNIHFKDGKVRLVDFQGLRLGPLGYDFMSLVMDPYVALPAALITELRTRFARGCRQDTQSVLDMTLAAGLQRLMQALGAYGYLGHAKGKREFLAYIPQGVKNLRYLLLQLSERQASNSVWLPPANSLLSKLLLKHNN